jgi:hypothetical protein
MIDPGTSQNTTREEIWDYSLEKQTISRAYRWVEGGRPVYAHPVR